MKSIFEVYKDYFPIGTAVAARSLETHKEILLKHFNSITAENEMKPIMAHRFENEYNFKLGDSIAEFAEKNNLMFRGHTLVWHNQTPEWFFKNGEELLPREVVLSKMKQHIIEMMTHYKYANIWDVANEVINDSEEGGMLRESLWLKTVGDDFVEMAFRYAREARVNDGIKLYYNDYNECNLTKRKRIVDLIKDINKHEKLIEGFGMQGHWNIHFPDSDLLSETIETYASLDIDIQVTELDISMFRFDEKESLPEPPKDRLEMQAEKYREIFEIFRKYKKYIKGITFWGAADDITWLSNFPVRNRKNWPLLFDDNHNPKEAFYKVVEF